MPYRVPPSSSLRTRAAKSGSLEIHPYCSLNRSIGRAGVPQTTCPPPRIVLPVGIPACAPMIAPLSSVQWSAIPTCPPITTFSPISVLPEMPTCAATTELRPILTLCATCTKLSIFTPAPTTVASSDPRSTVELHPISTSSPISTVPTCGNFMCCPSPNTYPNPSPPITTPVCNSTRSLIFAPAYKVTRGCSRQSRPTLAPRPRKQNASISAPCAMSTSYSTTLCG